MFIKRYFKDKVVYKIDILIKNNTTASKITIVARGMLTPFFLTNSFCKLYTDSSYVWITSVAKPAIMISKRANELHSVNPMPMFLTYIGYISKTRSVMYAVICPLPNKLKVYIIRFEKKWHCSKIRLLLTTKLYLLSKIPIFPNLFIIIF